MLYYSFILNLLNLIIWNLYVQVRIQIRRGVMKIAGEYEKELNVTRMETGEKDEEEWYIIDQEFTHR